MNNAACNNSKKLSFILILAILTTTFQYGHCFKLRRINGNHIRWSSEDLPITYYINKSDFSDADIEAIHRAFDKWESVPNSRLSMEFRGFTDKARTLEGEPADDTHLIIRIKNLPPEYIYLAEVVINGDKHADSDFPYLRDADIIFNGDKNWSSGSAIGSWEWDVESIALHEIGHFAIGIDHPHGNTVPTEDDRESVVEPIPKGAKVRELFSDDEEAVLFVYGRDLVAYYPFDGHDNFSGNENDESGNANHAIIRGANLTEDQFGNKNCAYGFNEADYPDDGIGEYIEVPHSPVQNLQRLTLAAWIYLPSCSAGTVISKGQYNKNASYALSTNFMLWDGLDKDGNPIGGCAPSIGFSLNNGALDVRTLFGTDLTSTVTEAWYHVAATYDGFKGIIYVNGERRWEENFSETVSASTEPLYIGAPYYYGNSSQPFVGRIDDVRVYDRALNDQEIQDLYNAPFSPVPSIIGNTQRVTTGDLNGDSKADLIGVTSTGQIFYTLDLYNWQSVSGTLAQVTAGDLNGNGVANLAGLSSGGEVYYTLDLWNWPNIPGQLAKLTCGDLNGDRKAELAGLSSTGDIYYTTDLWNWSYVPGNLKQIAAGDLNKDGRADIAGIASDGQIYYTFDLWNWNYIPGGLNQLAAGDLNGDGRADLAGVTSDGQIYYTLDLYNWQNIPGNLAQITSGDLNGDGRWDLAGLTDSGLIFYTLDLVNWNSVPGKLE